MDSNNIDDKLTKALLTGIQKHVDDDKLIAPYIAMEDDDTIWISDDGYIAVDGNLHLPTLVKYIREALDAA